MTHQLTISDETYLIIATLAKERSQTPEELGAAREQRQVEAEWEAVCDNMILSLRRLHGNIGNTGSSLI